jgi:radical SAM superfamily enzyme YgiQ (UPF0313 family)
MNQAATDSDLRRLRCVFVHAPDPLYADTQTYGAKFMPVWAYALAAHVPDDGRFEMRLYDSRFERIEDLDEADVFLFSGINQDCANLERVRAHLEARFPTAVFIIGGPMCWSFDQAGSLDQIGAFDHICIGDGEDLIGDLLDGIYHGRMPAPITRVPSRFNISMAKPLHKPLLDRTIGRYYGAVIEVSRGCPFLCEFCDIRVLKDNNRPHNLAPTLIVEEMDHVCRQGVKQIMFACDNFIGEPRWAEEVVDRILAWREKTGFRPNILTWLTINVGRYPRLLEKMRRAGFDVLFIGIESFDSNALRETAKMQNAKADIIDEVRRIQSYGFIIIAGIIFGFDSDDDSCFERGLKGLKDAALLSGDPSLLTALPGTPLYRRMKLSGRLRQTEFGLGGYKYETNIKYLLSRKQIVEGYKVFVSGFVDGAYQYARFKAYLDLLEEGSFVPVKGAGFGNPFLFVGMVIGNLAASRQMLQRLARFIASPANIYYALKGLGLVLSRRNIKGGLRYFQFWGFAWTNAVLKYQNLSDGDFNIESVADGFDIKDIVPSDYGSTASEDIPRQKIEAQLRNTISALNAVITERSGRN